MSNKYDIYLKRLRETDSASELENDSNVSGATVADALNNLNLISGFSIDDVSLDLSEYVLSPDISIVCDLSQSNGQEFSFVASL